MLVAREVSNGVFIVLTPGQPFTDASGITHPWEFVDSWSEADLKKSNLYRVVGPVGPEGSHLESLSVQRQGNTVVAIGTFTSPEIAIANAIANAISTANVAPPVVNAVTLTIPSNTVITVNTTSTPPAGIPWTSTPGLISNHHNISISANNIGPITNINLSLNLHKRQLKDNIDQLIANNVAAYVVILEEKCENIKAAIDNAKTEAEADAAMVNFKL